MPYAYDMVVGPADRTKFQSIGKEKGTYIRVAGTSRPADEAVLKDLEYQGAGK